MAATIATLGAGVDFGPNHRPFRRASNGVLWVPLMDGQTVSKFFYSTDDGATWQEDVTMRLTPTAVGTPNAGMCPDIFIDQDDAMHLVYLDLNASAVTGVVKYRRGVPNAGRTSYTWSAATQVGGEATSTSTLGYQPTVVAHRDPGSSPTTWSVHVCRGWYNGSTTAYAIYARLQLNSSGGVASQGITPFGAGPLTGWATVRSQASGADFQPSMSVRHTGDGRTVTTPDIYFLCAAPTNMDVNKLAWSSGTTWTDAGRFTVFTTSYPGKQSMACDGTRVIFTCANTTGATPQVAEIPYTASWVVGSLVQRTPTTAALAPATGVGTAYFNVVVHPPTGDIYLISVKSADSDLYYTKFTRATTTWDANWTSAYVGSLSWGSLAGDVTSNLGVDAVFRDPSATWKFQRAVAFNTTPTAPTLNTPAPASYQDLAAGYTFAWTFNDPDAGQAQSAYALRRKVVGAPSYEYWNAGTGAWQGTEIFNSTAVTSITFAAAKWTNGNTYQWSVATKDNFAYGGGPATGPYATDQTVVAQLPPSVVVNGPSGTIASSTPTITWSDTLPGSALQTNYQVIVESGAYGTTPGAGTQLWDSGVVVSAATSVAVPNANHLANTTTYRFFIRVTETGGQQSAWAYSTATTAITAPAVPRVTATADPGNARVTLAVSAGNVLSLDDASVEGSIGNWVNNTNATVARDLTQFADGVASLKMTSLAAGDMTARHGAGTTLIYAAQPNTQYIGLASFKTAAAVRNVRTRLVWYDAAGTFISQSEDVGVNDAAGAWTQATTVAVSPANAAFVRIVVIVKATAAANEVHFVDKVSVAPGNAAVWVAGGPTPNYYTVERSADGGATWTVVRGAVQLGYAAVATVYDYEAPSGQPLRYRATASSADLAGLLTSAPSAQALVTLTLTSAWLKDPANPARNVALSCLDGVSPTRQRSVNVLNPLGATYPVVQTDARRSRSLTIAVTPGTQAEADAIDALLDDLGTVLLLQRPASDPAGWRELSVYFVVSGDEASTPLGDVPLDNATVSFPATEVPVPALV